MIEKTILDYLLDNDLNAYMERPEKKPPGEYVLVEKTGSTSSNLLTTSTIAVQSYSNSLYGAASLNERVKTLMLQADKEIPISSCSLNTDNNFIDTATKQYRYQAVFEVTHKE